MHRRISTFTLTILALTAIWQANAQAQPALPEIEVTALATGRDNTSFAILKDIGMVEEGDVVRVSGPDVSFTLTVVSIDEAGVGIHVQKHFRRIDPKPEEGLDDTEDDRKALRDPFVPVG
jgi:hypothetical protein